MRTQTVRGCALLFAVIVGGLALRGMTPVPVAAQEKGAGQGAAAFPFTVKVETYRNKEGDVMVFALRLEQPFLAEEFEKSNYLRLQALDKNAYLVYPAQTKFHQKHAEFHGRLRGTGTAKVRITYEIVSENLDGTRRIDARHGDIEIQIPTKEGGPAGIYRTWAERQNAHFLQLLEHYPNDTFLQYVLLQSQARYGVPALLARLPEPASADVEFELYHLFAGSHAMQEVLQRRTLRTGTAMGDLNIHISALQPPDIRSLPYKELLEKRLKEKPANGAGNASALELAKHVPADQAFLHFQSMQALGELFDLSVDWGDNLLRLATIQARDQRLQEKLEQQLCLQRDRLTQLSNAGVIGELAMTCSDPYFNEGTDVTFLFRVKQAAAFEQAANDWLEQSKTKFPNMLVRDFNYRGHRIAARYSEDRMVSSFMLKMGDVYVFSNSHRGIRKMVEVTTGQVPRLSDAADYRYMATLLPPASDAQSGYLFISDAFLRYLVSPAFKISEKRRLQCFNNLVMLNNASLFYRMETGRSPASLSELIESRCVDPKKLTCPHGGAYAWDAPQDTCNCSLHNRLKYLTPNAELPVLQVSVQEQQEYERYKQRYQEFGRGLFSPIAVRAKVGQRVQLEVCTLPFAHGSLYDDLRRWVADKPQPLGTEHMAKTAILSVQAVREKKEIAEFLRNVPGVSETLEADPTLTDLSWLGRRLSLHFCDDDMIVEVDPAKLRALSILGTNVSMDVQTIAATAVMAMSLPVYVTVEVEDRDKAQRLLEQLSQRIYLKKGDLLALPTALDTYRLPDYKNHAVYVLSYQLYALKVRLHVALVGNRLVAATKAQTLRDVIDAATAAPQAQAAPPSGHLQFRANRRAVARLMNDLQLYWEEKARVACHGNIMLMYHLVKLYNIPAEEANRLVEAKYGVRCQCPDGGTYHYDAQRDQLECTVHGNRWYSKQNATLHQQSSFRKFIDSIDEVTLTLRFQQDEALFATLEIARTAKEKK
jgi:hypothetical protein